MGTRLTHLLDHLHQVLAPPGTGLLTDGQLLERFLAVGDEPSFAALVRRHGPMVWGVCRRVLGNPHDAEDAFQATFLILARHAARLRRNALAGWLYAVASRTARTARTRNLRRAGRERPLENVAHPEVAPVEPQDWRPLLDHELGRLHECYREAIVLCDLEGRSRKEAAQVLGVAEGTLSSRLARGRRLLAQRLGRYGLAISGGALATALAAEADAAVPVSLVVSTTKAATLVVAGQMAAVPIPAAALMKEVLKTMFLAKVKMAVATALVVAVFSAGGLIYRAAGEPAPTGGKPLTEVEQLHKELELLKLNLQVVLEKVRAQEAELQTLRPKPERAAKTLLSESHILREPVRTELSIQKEPLRTESSILLDVVGSRVERGDLILNVHVNPSQEVEAALKALREAPDKEAQRKAAEALDKAVQRLKEELLAPSPAPPQKK
jgi:RNA polymerase sigma factor (sigma-70 family)